MKIQLEIPELTRWQEANGHNWVVLSVWRKATNGPNETIKMLWVESETEHEFQYETIVRNIVNGTLKQVHRISTINA
ncbi:hypothetical protein [Siphonobacter sp. SORGH_AS_0500]|uniref:hypothetical protein n=1 Tax=Siphonobacter sp. SORGH_AS_0500 TaxID=1864824 RepID=UPI00285AFBD1|nr:hypothetical protein [Siphonobacter sp. SORGH_AS_0500]MDR6195198.1 hypothetical protein [Siphonobacter sp. SORGH_AS_0500]